MGLQLDSSRHFLMNAYYGYPHAGLGQGLLQYIVKFPGKSVVFVGSVLVLPDCMVHALLVS